MVVEFSTDGSSWTQLGEWPEERAEENWQRLHDWIAQTRTVGSFRKRPLAEAEAFRREHYPRLSDEERTRILRRLNREDPDADYID